MSSPISNSRSFFATSAVQWALLGCFSAIWAWVPLVLYGSAVIDDAYITFRYAENLAAGQGFVFNGADGPLLGTSTPLFTLLLAAGKIAGLDVVAFALGLGVAGAALAYFFGMLLFIGDDRAPRRVAAAIVWALVLGTLPEWVFVQISGMETMLFVGIAAASLWATASGRFRLAATLASLALLTRYDGMALAGLVLAWIVWRDRLRAWRALAVFAAIQVPWVLYAWMNFGSYWPQSVAAKHVIHTRTLWDNLLAHGRYFSFGLDGMVGSFLHGRLLPLCIPGIVALIARPGAQVLLPLWGIASVAGFSWSRIMLQGWYLMPALYAFSWVAILGLFGLFEWYGRFRSRAAEGRGEASPAVRSVLVLGPFLIVAILLLAQLRFCLADRGRWPQMRVARETAYFRAADTVRELGRAGQSVLVGEVGVLGFALKDFRILDSSGINSRLIHRARQKDVQRVAASGVQKVLPDLGTVGWVREILKEAKPDFLVSLDVILHLEKLAQESEFKQAYQLVEEIRVLPFSVPRSPVVMIYKRNPSADARGRGPQGDGVAGEEESW